MDTTSMYLKYVFNEAEKKDLGSEMARNISSKTSLEDEKKAVAADFTSRISRVDGDINTSATKLNQGYEMRNIECEIIKDFEEKVIRYKRTDTEEIVDVKPMKGDDLQLEMFEDEVG